MVDRISVVDGISVVDRISVHWWWVDKNSVVDKFSGVDETSVVDKISVVDEISGQIGRPNFSSRRKSYCLQYHYDIHRWAQFYRNKVVLERKIRRGGGRLLWIILRATRFAPAGGAFWSILNVFYYSLLRNRKTLRTLESGHFNLRTDPITWRMCTRTPFYCELWSSKHSGLFFKIWFRNFYASN